MGYGAPRNNLRMHGQFADQEIILFKVHSMKGILAIGVGIAVALLFSLHPNISAYHAGFAGLTVFAALLVSLTAGTTSKRMSALTSPSFPAFGEPEVKKTDAFQLNIVADGLRNDQSSYLDIVYEDLDLKPGDYAHQLVDYLVNSWLGGPSLDSDGTPTKSLLDVGAGKGAQAAVFSRYFNITTLDRHGDARQTFESLNINARVVVAEIGNQAFPLPDNSFDVVFTKSVIEHVENWEQFLTEINRVLKPGGSVIVMTPDWSSQKVNFYDDPTHIRPYTKRALDRVLRMTGFDDIQIEDIYQLPFTWRMPFLKIIPWLVRKLPDSMKWRDRQQRRHRVLVRFSKETMLLALARKR